MNISLIDPACRQLAQANPIAGQVHIWLRFDDEESDALAVR